MGLQREPRGYSLDPGNHVFKLEKAVVLNTCGMFGITGTRKRAAVNKNGAPSWGYRNWLPGMDSNHDSRLQRPLSYH